MCEQCQDLQKQIDQYTRLLKRGFDKLTEERMRAVLAELEARKNELHLAQPTQ